LGAKYLDVDGTPARKLEITSADQILKLYPTRSSDSKPYACAVDGSNLIFGPYPDSDYTIKGTYYARPDSIISTVDTFFTNNPDLYLWAAMAELEQFMKNDKRIEVWVAKRNAILADINNEAKGVSYSGTLAMRVV
jgi:hypothetical protein